MKTNVRKVLREEFDVGGMKGTDLSHRETHKFYTSVTVGVIKRRTFGKLDLLHVRDTRNTNQC